MGFATFMSSSLGRGLRGVAGLALIALGLATGSIVLVIVGVVPLAASVSDVCLFAPLFGASLKSADVRAKGK